jgi:hypothetical protein
LVVAAGRTHRIRILGLGVLIALAVVGAIVLGKPLLASSPATPVTVGAQAVSADYSTIVLTLTGPTGPGKLSGSTITARITSETRFGGGLKRGEPIGSVPLIVTIDANPNSDGSYALLAIDTRVR